MKQRRCNAGGSPGFTLLELLLALCLGTLLFALLLRLIGADLQLGRAMALRLSESSRQRRSLELIREELGWAHGWMVDPPPSAHWPCRMAGRRPVLAIAVQPGDEQARGAQVIVYSVGPAPDRIWRGWVLMRCGPAFDLWGGIRRGSRYQNRVVLDGVDRFQLHQPSGLPVLHMQLEQRTRLGGRVRSQGVG